MEGAAEHSITPRFPHEKKNGTMFCSGAGNRRKFCFVSTHVLGFFVFSLIDTRQFGRHDPWVLVFEFPFARVFEIKLTRMFFRVPMLVTKRHATATRDRRQSNLGAAFPTTPFVGLHGTRSWKRVQRGRHWFQLVLVGLRECHRQLDDR